MSNTNSKAKQVVLPGYVRRILKSVDPVYPEIIEVCLPTAQPLYQEIRFENSFIDENGRPLLLKVGDGVSVTLKIESQGSIQT